MKNIKFFVILASAALLASSCIKETFPTDAASTEQLATSTTALAASVNGIPAQLVQGYLIYGDQVDEYDMAYPGIMMALDQCAGEIIDNSESGSGYDWYSFWSGYGNFSMGPKTDRSYVPWRAFYMFVKSANDIIGAIDDATATELQTQYKGMAYANRAWQYLNLVRIYEYKAPTDPTVSPSYLEGADKLLGLGVPIVTETTTLEESKNNPRAKVEDIYELIFSDLDKAEAALEKSTENNNLFPSLAVVYGLKARAYLERGYAGVPDAFTKAADYATKAITVSGCTPLTKEQWHDPKTGFNTPTSNNSWMWSIKYSEETMGNLCTFVGHMSVEPTWTAYAYGPCRGIPSNLYNTIPNSDWRKYTWIDPKGKDFYDYQTNRELFDPEKKPAEPYTSLKFRPGGGDTENYSKGGATSVPLMRVEEMYFIKAEALVKSGAVDLGVQVLKDLMITRNPSYAFSSTDETAIINEILRQKRIEFWGEGIIFFDLKRLAAGQIHVYDGTNAFGGQRFNCTGVCPWWNWAIPQSELEGNPALEGFNNPDPTGSVKELL